PRRPHREPVALARGARRAVEARAALRASHGPKRGRRAARPLARGGAALARLVGMKKSPALLLAVLLAGAVAVGAWYFIRAEAPPSGSATTPPSGSATKMAATKTPKAKGGRGFDGSRPVPVLAEAARTGDISVYVQGLGTVTPLRTVTVRSRVEGELLRVAFREGQLVREGELLAEIDPRPFQVQLLQAEGQLARDEALLAN